MYKVKFNTHSIRKINLDRLESYYNFYGVRPDEEGYIYPTITVLKMIIAFSKISNNAANILTDNEELIAATLSERTLNSNDLAYINQANNPFINSIIALIT